MSFAAWAKPVSPRLASDVASVFFPGSDLTITEIDGLYLFAPVSGNGFVLVAGDDCVRPVLAWSPTGTFPVDNMPQHLRSWIDGYVHEIEAFTAIGDQSPRVAAEWEMYLNGRPKSAIAVEPLLTTRWNQAPYFNLLCPYDWTDSAYSVTGCTATATAQIMKYWNHPEVGWGSHSYYHPNYGVLSAQFDTTHYLWSMMPDTLNYLCSSEEINAVAVLMYHVGVACNMNYSPSGSGAAVNSYGYANYPSAENALKSYFKYSPLLRSEYKAENSDQVWDSLIRSEIDAARPVLYAGYDNAGGHAFVLDGYDSLGMFHVNWGWGGAYDGYYTIDSLSPGAGGIGGNATYTFNMNNSIVIGIAPVTMDTASDSLVVVNMVNATPGLGTIVGNGTYPLYDMVNVVARANTGNRFVRWTSGNTSNPVSFLAFGDVTDTAIFEHITGDTLGYCYDAMRSSWHDDYSDTTEWGIRLPVDMRKPGHDLTAVQLYIYESEGDYTLSVYRADSINGATPVYTQSFYANPWQGWQTVVLDSTVRVDDYKPLWIAIRHVGSGYPAAMGRYVGNSDGCWYRLPDPFRPAGSEPVAGEGRAWRRYDHYGEYTTWMLRAVLEPRPVVVEVYPADENHCTVFGGGDYLGGDTVTIGAIVLDPRCHFSHWSDGTPSNPYSFVAISNIMLLAHCECESEGIADVDADLLQVSTDGLVINVNADVDLYDIQGRRLGHGQRLVAPAAGVYILRSGPAAKKVVVR